MERFRLADRFAERHSAILPINNRRYDPTANFGVVPIDAFPYRPPMRPLRALVIYVVVVFIGGALIAPWLYWLCQHFASAFPHLAASPFHRYVNRSLLGLALIGLWPLLRSLGATSLREVGLVWPAGQWKKLGAGFLLGFVSLAVAALAALAFGARQMDPHLATGELVRKLFGAALTAAVVAVLEEVLFRGAIFGALRKMFHWVFALVVSSMVYAIVHFMQSADVAGSVTWLSGLQLLPRMLAGFGDLHAIVPGFFNLTLVGAMLALVYQRTGNLYFSIGLHGGWIFWLKSYGAVTRPIAAASAWWGTSKLTDGWMTLAVLACALLVFTKLPVARSDVAARVRMPMGGFLK